ncbi:PREDICTED: serine protease 55 [Galeopterus variegatus]|uniref:Serine protease 55 n=1 Tax=Galeopterus variegatus TaxID=482537 RepID=A0ABM0S9Z8_GALVR|nr:PREDICTED: serine protease 55 [Galeopterus variegatus]
MLLLAVLLLMWPTEVADLGCGERPVFEGTTRHSRIVGGMEAEVGEFPWQVSIQAGNEHFCGGTVLSKWWVLTAAHCFYSENLSPKDLTVVVGANDLTSSSVEVKEVTSIVSHKDFQRASMDNDIALLLLASPVKLSGLTVPICLPSRPLPTKWHECWVAGWGQTDAAEKNSMTTDLMKVPMVIIDWQECLKVFAGLTKNMLCAGYQNESYDACQGDSGGAFICTPGPGMKWYQVGIVSWGRSCGQKDTPGIYTLLENYKLWIENVTQLEGRPLDTKEMRTPPQHKPKRSWASGLPEPGSLCLLSYILFRAIFY